MLCCQKSLLFLFICGWVFNKFGKMQCERKIQKQTNKFREAIARKQRFGHNYIQILQDYIYCPRHEVPMGFSTVCTERVIQFSRPDGRSYWTLRRRDWIFPIATRFPTLRCKTKVSRAMKPWSQNRSRTSLQDRDPACKRNLWDALRCKIGIPRAKLFESNVRHPWKGSGPLLTKNLTGRRLRHSC